MRRHTNAEVTIEASIYPNGVLYVGVNATEPLGLQYNDRVRVTVPRDNRPDKTFEGCLTKADQITVGREAYLTFREENESGTIHVDAIVEPVARTWDDDHDMTSRRSDGYYTLDSKF